MRPILKENATFQILATIVNFSLILLFNGDLMKAIVPALIATALMPVLFHINWWMWSRRGQDSKSGGRTSETHQDERQH